MSFSEFITADHGFEAEVIEAMGRAFEEAAAAAGLTGRGPRQIREIIAQRIIDAARTGERRPERLCSVALASLGLK